VTTNNWEDAFDCLQARERRAVLLTLHERTSRPYLLAGGTDETGTPEGDDEDVLMLDDVDVDLDPIRMHHVHLPKLTEAGYVESSDDGERVTPGDAFEEIQPLLDVLEENQEALPGIAG
jgi:hypothetical protein